MTEAATAADGEAFVEDLISHKGSEREALRYMLAEYLKLQRRYELARVAVSAGYSRGWHQQAS